MDNPGPRHLCIPCTDLVLATDPAVPVEMLPYKPFIVLDYSKELEAERARLAMEAEFEERKREAKHRQETRAVALLQRVWRGSRSRHSNREFVAERKEWLAQRKRDEKRRHQALYRTMLYLGVAPDLESDTVYEKVVPQCVARHLE